MDITVFDFDFRVMVCIMSTSVFSVLSFELFCIICDRKQQLSLEVSLGECH